MFEKREAFWRHMDDSAGVRKPMERKVFNRVVFPPANKHFKYNQKAINNMLIKREIRFKCQKCGYIHNDPAKEWVGCPKCNTDKPKLQYLVQEKTFENIQSNWTDIPGYSSTTGYPTENSEVLLKRVISIATKRDDLILDCFAGSGTTGAVAEKLGRRWIMCDFGKHAIYTMQKRILRIAESKKLGEKVKKNQKYGKGPNPFCVVSVGGYDFSRVMNLRENKEAYINFVLGLFGLGKSDDDLVKKYKLPNVYAEKENNPVEVYPVWEDSYLKEIKIDQEYLQSIIDQTKGRLKGDYYIITPVSCTNISDISLANAKKENVNFKLLSFPYKILEEAARSFSIHEQPSSSTNINDLISSVGYYFNEKVTIKAKKTKEGLKITEFNSNITDSKGDKFEGLDGLAMILLDKDHDKKVFDMEEAVYAKDIGDSGIIKTSGITKDSYIIAVDKHGNESAPTQIHE
jgi:predicted Zn-ribbon and HTH transcriptional regulator